MVFRLFAYEFKKVYKQTLVFSVISTFLFALSISVLCFSSDMLQGYKDYLDEVEYYDTVAIYDATKLEKYEEFDKLGYTFAQAYGISARYKESEEFPGATESLHMLQNGENTGGNEGAAYIFRDGLPKGITDYFTLESGKYTGAKLNTRDENGRYSVFVEAKDAERMEVVAGDTVTFNYELIDGIHAEEFTVAGILKEKESGPRCWYDFFFPFAFLYEHEQDILTYEDLSSLNTRNICVELENASDIMDILPKVRNLCKVFGGSTGYFEEIDLVNTMRYILWAVAVAIVIVTFVVLSNSLTVTVNSRKKFMAKLKLLGATTDKVAAVYFILLIVSFIAAYALSILLSYLLCGYFSSIASVALEYKITMKLHWGAVGILFGAGCVLLAVRYLLFRRKVKKVAPAEFIKEE